MRKKFNLQRAMEELEVDKAIREVENEDKAPTADSLLEQAEKLEDSEEVNPEDNGGGSEDTGEDIAASEETKDDEGEDSKDSKVTEPDTEEGIAAENLFKGIELAVGSIKSLEEIANIIEASEDTNGLSTPSIPVINTVINSVYSDVGITPKDITNSSFENLSERISIAKEFLSDIKDKILFIWKAIISQFKKIFKFLKEAWSLRKFKLSEDLVTVTKLRKAYDLAESKLRDKPIGDSIRNSYFGVLVTDYKTGTYDDLAKTNARMINMAKEFISENGSNAKKSAENIKSVKTIVSDFVTELDRVLALQANPDETDKINDIVSNDVILKPPSFTSFYSQVQSNDFEIKISGELAGGYCIQSSTPKNPNGLDSLEFVKLQVVESPGKERANKKKIAFEIMEYPTSDELSHLIDMLGTTVRTSEDLLKHLESLETLFNDFIKFSEKIEKQISSSNKFKNKESYVFARHSKAFSKFVNACNGCYLKGAVDFDNYFFNYKAKLLSFTKHCFKAYL